MAKLDLNIGAMDKHMVRQDADAKQRLKLLQSIYPVDIPAKSGTVTAGGVLSIVDPEQLGPREGWIWDVHRISVFGLHAATESVQIFKTPGGGSAAQVAQNFVCTLLPVVGQPANNFAAFQTFGKGQCVLKAGYSLQIVGASLTATEIVTFSGDATAIAEPFIGDYFL